ncbi:MAG: hypothetical protein ACUVTD_03375 [Nitrososphaerales archaeon]
MPFYLLAHGYAIEDLEMEIDRLKRALEGKGVGMPIVDIVVMREGIGEKDRASTILLKLGVNIEGALKK